MKKFLKSLWLKFSPIKTGDSFYGFTNELSKDKDIKHLKKIISVYIVGESSDTFDVMYRYFGKGGYLVTGKKDMKKKYINDHYINDRLIKL